MDLKEIKALRDSQEKILILMMWKDKVEWLIEQTEKAEELKEKVRHYEMMYHNTGAMFNRMTMKAKIERYEKALKEIANPDASEYLSWQDDMTEQGNDLNEWDWFSSIAKIALETKS